MIVLIGDMSFSDDDAIVVSIVAQVAKSSGNV